MNIHNDSLFILLLFILAAIPNWCKLSIEKGGNMTNATVIQMQNASASDSIIEDSVIFTDKLYQFKSVVDTLNLAGDQHVHSEYFLYDISGDGNPELWIKSGSCEADYRLMAYTLDCGTPRKIYEGNGGHSDYFIYNGQLVCVMCNTGSGLVITYKYNGKRVVDSMIEFSMWNDKKAALSEPHDSIADEKLKYWEDSYRNYIELKPL